ncbi:MAG TPA: NADH-quinone oxidoreductase subunit N [Planctomycetota bacterium]|jgi:NADH-quinone oxidoreductase subunit N|nr:NADH-quinone oxidoreductase subunit N [Planctomycetota bacterium]
MHGFDAADWLAISPLAALTVGLLVLLVLDLAPGTAILRVPVFLGSLIAAAGFELRILREQPALVFDGTLASGPTTALWGLVFLASLLVAWTAAQRFYREERRFLVEHDVLMMSSVVGMMLMAGAQNLLVFFVGLELLSVPLYALASFERSRSTSVEAGVKYFVLGAFAAAIFLYGAALIYAGTGTISLPRLREIGIGSPIALLGTALVFGSLFFKVSVFPFHLWVPDVYQGSPTPVTALMATGTKAAGFAFLLEIAFLLPARATGIVVAIALLTMAAGNLGALVQNDLKRMLAWSGIAHAGTLLLAVAGSLAGDPHAGGARTASIFYMAAYVVTAGGAFVLVAALEADTGEPVTLVSLRGLARRRPGAAAAMGAFMLSLGGIPLTGGFLGKYLVFAVAVRAGLVAAAVAGVLLSVVALGYYLRVVVAMYMQPEAETAGASEAEPRRGLALFAASACAAGVLLLGILPGWLLDRL